MDERGMQNDPRYSQARQLQQTLTGGRPPSSMPPPSMPPSGPEASRGYPPSPFAGPQMVQLRAQIMAYRILARNQPLPPQISLAVQVRKSLFSCVPLAFRVPLQNIETCKSIAHFNVIVGKCTLYKTNFIFKKPLPI